MRRRRRHRADPNREIADLLTSQLGAVAEGSPWLTIRKVRPPRDHESLPARPIGVKLSGTDDGYRVEIQLDFAHGAVSCSVTWPSSRTTPDSATAAWPRGETGRVSPAYFEVKKGRGCNWGLFSRPGAFRATENTDLGQLAQDLVTAARAIAPPID